MYNFLIYLDMTMKYFDLPIRHNNTDVVSILILYRGLSSSKRNQPDSQWWDLEVAPDNNISSNDAGTQKLFIGELKINCMQN